jgi:hypothetical protein
MVTVYPLACNNLANDAEMIPLPREDVTPPVTKMYLVLTDIEGVYLRARGLVKVGIFPTGTGRIIRII